MSPRGGSLAVSPRIEGVAGVLLLILWAAIQFGIAPPTGWIHVLLAAGVVLLIRGIARSD